MRPISLIILCILPGIMVRAQQHAFTPNNLPNNENIYSIKQQYLTKVLHNPSGKNAGGEDNDLERFNRWFHFVEPRCYPSGNLPRPDVLLKVYEKQKATSLSRKTASGNTQRTTSGSTTWQSIGPTNVPAGFFGIGRVNCVVIDPIDTNTLYAGAACGGVWISHDGGHTWATNSDNFPSLSIADIAINPKHTDTLYAATGDRFGAVFYGQGMDNIFMGGLYSAGVMKSTDGGATWHTTGLSYLQSNRDMVQNLLIEPNNPNILLAATLNGIYRTADAGATWSQVCGSSVYNMVFRPSTPDTVYAMNDTNLIVSYNAGITWSVLHSLNTAWGAPDGDRCTVAVSAAEPDGIWVMTNDGSIYISNDDGLTFPTVVYPGITSQGYYDHIIGVSPADPNNIYAAGVDMQQSLDGGNTWNPLSSTGIVHPDNHSIAFNPLNPATFYTGNDGGVWKTTDNGITWFNLSNGLVISQIYRISSSRQNPYIMLCGLQDNATFYNDGTNWLISNGPFGDGMDCAIFPGNDSFQIASIQESQFSISTNKGNTFNAYGSSGYGVWTAPVVFNPRYPDTIYFGADDVYASYDTLFSAMSLNSGSFSYGVVSLAISPSNSQVLYAADFSHIIRTTNAGATWTDVTGPIFSDSLPITHITVDYSNPMLVYVTVSGYHDGQKVYMSNTGGISWTNISGTLPNIPVNCLVVDSSVSGALFVGTDIGVYYQDLTTSGWELYNSSLPNVIVNALEINYTNRKIRAATYGRGVWETDLQPPSNLEVSVVSKTNAKVALYPNPSNNRWQLMFPTPRPKNYTVTVSDITGNTINTLENPDYIDASKLACGVYNITVAADNATYNLKAIKE